MEVERQLETLQEQLTKQALGLNTTTLLVAKPSACPNHSTKELDPKTDNSQFSRYESIYDDEFDDCFDVKSSEAVESFPSSSSIETPVSPNEPLCKDINEINKAWREKREKALSSGKSTEHHIETDSVQLQVTAPVNFNGTGDKFDVSSIKVHLNSSNADLHSKLQNALQQNETDPTSGDALASAQDLFMLSTIPTALVTNDAETSREEARMKELEELKSFAPPQNHNDDEEDFEAHLSVKSEDQTSSPYKVESDDEDDTSVCPAGPSPSLVVELKNCSEEEILGLFQDPKLVTIATQPTLSSTGWGDLKRILFGPPKLIKSLHNERNSIFGLAKVPFDNSNPLHNAMLFMLYRNLTNASTDCGRIGPHWGDIGFQGHDPSTDFRACGMLGLFHLVHLTLTNFSLATAVHRLSNHETANFPFAVLSINLTRIAMQILREGHLNKLCNSEKDVIGPFNQLFAAIMNMFHSKWKNLDKTILNMGYVIQDIEESSRKSPRSLVLQHRRNESSQTSIDSSVKKQTAREDNETFEFIGIEQLGSE